MMQNSTRAILLSIAALLLGACSRDEQADEGPESVPDQVVLDNLKDAGSDLSKPHDIDFTFYFPDAASATRFVLKTGGQASYEIDSSGDETSVQITRTFVPSLAEIEKTSADLAALAEAEGGEFDGWGAAVVN